MTRTIQNRVNNILRKVFTSDFILSERKEKGKDYYQGFKNKWTEVESPSMYSLWKMVYKLQTFKILQDRGSIASGKTKSVKSGEKIAFVS